MTDRLNHIFDDAHRRVCIAKRRGEKSRARIWTGLALPYQMKAAISAGLMQPIRHETPRVLNWYTFTAEGWKEYDRRYKGKPDWFDKAAQPGNERK